jgi:hypothetical protein
LRPLRFRSPPARKGAAKGRAPLKNKGFALPFTRLALTLPLKQIKN